MARSRSRSATAPVGLWGVFTKIAFVRSVTRAAIASGSYTYPSAARSGTPTATPPASRTFSATSVHIGSGRITSSAGSSSAEKVTNSPCIDPLVTKIPSSSGSSTPLSRASLRRMAERSAGMPLFGG
jgi:hypothetical protein